MNADTAKGWFTIQPRQFKNCRRCGKGELGWAKSTRTGKFYLAETRPYLPGGRHNTTGLDRANRRWVMPNRPHRCEEK